MTTTHRKTAPTGIALPCGRRLRVLQLVQDLAFGGMERLVAAMAGSVDRSRFDLQVLTVSDLGHCGRDLPSHIPVHRAPPLPPWTMFWPAPLMRLLRRIEPDVVHTHLGIVWKGSIAARVAGVPRLVHTEHGRLDPDPWIARTLLRVASRWVDVIVPVSRSLDAQLRDRIVPSSVKTEVIPNGVDTERFRPEASDEGFRARLRIPAEAPIIGSVGRLDPIKDYSLMLKAFSRLHSNWEAGPRPHLVIAGDGIERALLEQLTRELQLNATVHWLGWCDEILAVLNALSLFSLSSRSEGMSLSLLEAMSCGACPVVTDVGGNAEVLGSVLSHRLVRERTADSLAAAWVRALSDREQLERDGLAARQRVESDFSLRAMVRRYESLWMSGQGSDASV
ncbi:MAG: glycosyltransferase [Acidobacteriota bacterium]|nr:MAG: glycosyltransferase [Acidobacteriota bacterium]